MPRPRCQALLTVDLPTRVHPEESDFGSLRPVPRAEDLERQIDLTMQALARLEIRATFFCPAKLTSVLPSNLWQGIARVHRIGSRGFEGRPVGTMSPEHFLEDVRAARTTLEDVSGSPVVAYRAPELLGDDRAPWFCEGLLQTGHRIDSSCVLAQPPDGFTGSRPLGDPGAEAIEVPLMAVAVGSRKFAVVGGGQLRLLPLASIRLLLERAASLGFRPMIFLYPEDFDTKATATEAQGPLGWVRRAGEIAHRLGRETIEQKLEALAYRYAFEPLESVLDGHAEGQAEPTSVV